ncbi:MAG TPA: LysM domain-containing protein, partial [Anaerovoracaceae bacterium]|nr:LysM domain-containing protein [Anaerovoracaceae bacterium]
MQRYIVKPKDTFYLIAKEFNVPLAQLIKANPQVINPNLIYEGQTIIIPDLPPIPNQLDVLDSNAEDMIDVIYAADWQKAIDMVNVIRTTMNALVPALQAAEVPNDVIFGINAAIRSLEQNIAQRKTFSAISQANRITQLIADALDYFNVIIPTDVNRLDYFGRQIIVNVEQNDWAEANQNYLRAKMVWERLKPQLEVRYSNDVAQFDQILNDLHAAIDRKDYQQAINNANKMLDQVDILE